MDPNETLKVLREMVARVFADDNADDNATELAETFDNLDNWITRGGFLPEGWQS